MRRSFRVWGLAAALAACKAGADSPQQTMMTATSTELSPAERALAKRRIYFAHQSVGNDIVSGIETLAREAPDLAIKTVVTTEPSVLAGPAFVHFRAGRNTNPASKNADFLRLFDRRPSPDQGIALLKYCYVDALDPRDSKALFEDYQRTIQTLRERHPDVRVVHATMPLTTVESGSRAFVKRLLGKRTVRELAIKRHGYNRLVRAAYAGREPLFDIADLESLRPDGSRAFFVAEGDTIPTLAEEYTVDGGHLNARGQRIAARAMLQALARASNAP